MSERRGKTGGDGGIRTLDRALQPYNGLANRRLQPLGHISAAAPGAAAEICPTAPAIARAAAACAQSADARTTMAEENLPSTPGKRNAGPGDRRRLAIDNQSPKRRRVAAPRRSEAAPKRRPRLNAMAGRNECERKALADQTGRKRRTPNLISRCSLERPRHGATGVSVGAAGGGTTFLRFAGALRAFLAADFLVALRAPSWRPCGRPSSPRLSAWPSWRRPCARPSWRRSSWSPCGRSSWRRFSSPVS